MPISLNQEDIARLVESFKELGDVRPLIDNLANSTNSFQEIVAKLTDRLKLNRSEVGKLQQDLMKVQWPINDTEKQKQKLDELAPIINVVTGYWATNTSAMEAFTKHAGISSESTKNLGSDFKELNQTLTNMPVLSKIPGIGAILDHFGSIAETTHKAIGSVKSYENQLMSLQAQYGGFETAGKRLEFIESLDKNMIQFTQTQTALANTLNLSTKEVTDYSMKFMKIPGAYSETIKVGDELGGSMSMTEAALRATRGTTGDLDHAIAALDFQYKQFGQTNREGLDLLTQTYKVSQNLGVAFGDLEKPIKDIAQQFASLGDNSEAAVRMVNQLGTSLKSTGLGITPTLDIITSITSGIHNMNTAQKAFLSQQTGGSGGLKGAFEIDLLLQQGKMDEVYGKMQESLMKQFGGNVVGLEDAASSDTAAAQMQKQLAFIMEGPFGSLVKDQGQAIKLLESFSKGESGGALEIGDTLSEAIESDSELQKRQFDVTQNISNTLKEALNLSQLTFALQARQAVGSDNEKLSALISDLKKDSGRAKNLISGESKYESLGTASINSLSKTYDVITDTMPAVTDGFSNMIGNLRSSNEAQEQFVTRPGIAPPTNMASERGLQKLEFEPLEVNVNVVVQNESGQILKQERTKRATAATGMPRVGE